MPYGDIKLRQLESTDARLARLNGELREASAQTILRVAMVREWPEQLTYVSSFGAESVAMLSLIAEVDPSLPVVFLDTGMHFPQTLDYRDEVIERLGLTGVRSIPPNETERKGLDP
ncbi:MAG TPA: phosphoadenylyl-sulfate reductase, partial [Hyphomonas adhaerens]|nr:phosphoadenylyl-sulfate reductase [Hyphomonas adhaerens]